jgi:hypothetical protein
MDEAQFRAEATRTLEVLNSLYDPGTAHERPCEIQFRFRAGEGNPVFAVRLSSDGKRSEIREGEAERPDCVVEAELSAWEEVSGGYTSAAKAVRQGRLSIRGRASLLRTLYRGRSWVPDPGLYTGRSEPGDIRKVLLLNCAPRGERGATGVAASRLAAGLRSAGAEVKILYPARMAIRPCVGCFRCWSRPLAPCTIDDDMPGLLEAYRSSDLVVWATPIYHYFGSTAMKTVMDRLFVNADPHVVRVEGRFRHPRKIERLPRYALLAVGGFPDFGIFKPLESGLRALSEHTGIEILGSIRRHTSMAFAVKGLRMKAVDDALAAIEDAGRELVELRRIKPGTKRTAERAIGSASRIVAMANAMNGNFADAHDPA